MTPEDFQKEWLLGGGQLINFSSEVVQRLAIPTDQKRFLTDVGLPDSAAPFLDFGGKHYLRIPSVADLWKAGEDFNRYKVIGSNGFGDPVCVDENSSGTVVYLNHDDGMKRQLINSSVQCLAYSLLAFRTAVRKTRERGGPDAYLDGRIPNDIADQFIIRMDEIDSEAIKPETFWFRSIIGEGI